MILPGVHDKKVTRFVFPARADAICSAGGPLALVGLAAIPLTEYASRSEHKVW
jgi:hypothetical protein